MNRKLSSIIISALVATALVSCDKDSDSDSYGSTDISTSTMVTSFSLGTNNKIMANLDSVYFSIDLANRRIYNADSLPYGTDVSKLTVSVKATSGTTLEMSMSSRFDGNDTIVNLSKNPTDSINFASGVTSLIVTAPDKTTMANYIVKVNVHKVLPDSLTWTKSERGNLPGTIPSPTSQRAVQFGSELLSLTATSRRATLCTTSNPYDFNSWTETDVTLPEGADVNTFTATSDALYIVCADGSLHRADDASLNWTEIEPAGSGWTHLYGAFNDMVVGVRGTKWATFPPSVSGELNDLGNDFPVTQTSQLVTYTSDWNLNPQALMAGGLNASGEQTGATWAFDGRGWFRLSATNGVRSLPAAEGYTIFPYFTFTSTSGLQVTKRATWFAIGYTLESGKATSTVYTSQDNGISWFKASDNLQLPSDVTPRYCAQTFICPRTITQSRAVKPITEWDADYIYMFGGRYFDSYDQQVKVSNQLWRAIIERLAFKPLQ